MKTKQIIFHGGCIGCNAQELESENYCHGCMYFNANWDLPNLSLTEETPEQAARKRINKHFDDIATAEKEKLAAYVDMIDTLRRWLDDGCTITSMGLGQTLKYTDRGTFIGELIVKSPNGEERETL